MKILASFTLVSLLLISCTRIDAPTDIPPTSPDIPVLPDPLDQTPRENYEAEIVALWLSGELVAPQELYEEVRDGLKSIREQFSDSIPAVRFCPRPYWVAGEIAGMFSEQGAADVRNGTYTDMDSLNAALRLSRMDTFDVDWLNPKLLYFHLYFKGRLHPERLIEMYEKLPSLLYVHSGYLFIGDRSQYYPKLLDIGVSYLFREGWGDCPSGCVYSKFWYFLEIYSNIEYVDCWDPQSDPAPIWWEEAKKAPCELHDDFCNW